MRDYLDNVFVAVYPVAEASKDSLMALGQVLAALKLREPRISKITGVEELLAGRYPPANDATPVVPNPEGEIDLSMWGRGRFSIHEPWKYCPAVIETHQQTLPEQELVALLQQVVGPEVGRVVVNFGSW
ncbi:MAG: hypothetical protein U0401_30170 [Anaerolineae bacterium]